VYVLKASARPNSASCSSAPAPRRCPAWNSTRRTERLIGLADGDARRLLNLLEQIVRTAATTADRRVVDATFSTGALAKNLRRFDKGGDAFYDQISALHKSVRGSNPDAALYWLVRMLDGGADPLYLARRIVRMAVEDIGLADPRALQIALNAVRDLRAARLAGGRAGAGRGGDLLACAAKSNAAYVAYNAARKFVGAMARACRCTCATRRPS
jgi:putative ATPase